MGFGLSMPCDFYSKFTIAIVPRRGKCFTVLENGIMASYSFEQDSAFDNVSRRQIIWKTRTERSSEKIHLLLRNHLVLRVAAHSKDIYGNFPA